MAAEAAVALNACRRSATWVLFYYSTIGAFLVAGWANQFSLDFDPYASPSVGARGLFTPDIC